MYRLILIKFKIISCVIYIYNRMNKKQTIRTLGSIESKQTKQSKKAIELIEHESDDNIEVNSEPEEEEYIEP